MAGQRDAEVALRRVPVQERLPDRRYGRTVAGNADGQPGRGGLSEQPDGGQRDRLARGDTCLRRDKTNASRNLGTVDGPCDRIADRKYRDGLRYRQPGPEGG